MKKILSAAAVVGIIASLSISAFAADRLTAENGSRSPMASETYVKDLGDGVSTDDVMKDIMSATNTSNPGKDVQTGLGAGTDTGDTAKDIQ